MYEELSPTMVPAPVNLSLVPVEELLKEVTRRLKIELIVLCDGEHRENMDEFIGEADIEETVD